MDTLCFCFLATLRIQQYIHNTYLLQLIQIGFIYFEINWAKMKRSHRTSQLILLTQQRRYSQDACSRADYLQTTQISSGSRKPCEIAFVLLYITVLPVNKKLEPSPSTKHSDKNLKPIVIWFHLF